MSTPYSARQELRLWGRCHRERGTLASTIELSGQPLPDEPWHGVTLGCGWIIRYDRRLRCLMYRRWSPWWLLAYAVAFALGWWAGA